MRMAIRMSVLDAQGRHVASLKAEIEKCYARACARSTAEELAFQDQREVDIMLPPSFFWTTIAPHNPS
jgi:hypothetical protein